MRFLSYLREFLLPTIDTSIGDERWPKIFPVVIETPRSGAPDLNCNVGLVTLSRESFLEICKQGLEFSRNQNSDPVSSTRKERLLMNDGTVHLVTPEITSEVGFTIEIKGSRYAGNILMERPVPQAPLAKPDATPRTSELSA